jgi:ATP-dependent DNA helicase DinG
MESLEQSLFPHEEFREKQHPTLSACVDALDEGYKNIVLDAPVGTGKSGICTALARYADNAFYCTPQKSLRKQIRNDDDLEPFVEELKSRRDTYCSVTKDNCKDCSVYRDPDGSCARQQSPTCNYWRRKQSVMASDVAVITFAMLIIDGILPVYSESPESPGDSAQISFDDRDMVIVDEAHGLVRQTREMHAGFDLTPVGLPENILDGVMEKISWDADSFDDVSTQLSVVQSRCQRYVGDVHPAEMNDEEKRCHNLAKSIKGAEKDVRNDRPWVVDVESRQFKGNHMKVLELRPIDVSSFLKNRVWSRGNKRVISTATLPSRGNPDVWLRNVGLDPEETKIINVGMTFPPGNRPVITHHMVDSMSGGNWKNCWDEIMDTLNTIAEKHAGHKGICHTVSYSRAEKVMTTIDEEENPFLHNNVYMHDRNEEAEDAVDTWQNSDRDMILSPSMMEGIDLPGDMGRYNILMKIPYPVQSSVTDYLLNETDYGWHLYNDNAAIRTAQSYGRTNRSKKDKSNFYILDEDYKTLKKRATLPKWMLEAEGYPEVGVRSVFDY